MLPQAPTSPLLRLSKPQSCGLLPLWNRTNEPNNFTMEGHKVKRDNVATGPHDHASLALGCSAYRAVDAVTHWPLRLVLIFAVVTSTGMSFLNTVTERLPCSQINLISIHQAFRYCANVCNQAVKQIHRHGFAHYDAQNFRLLLIRRQRIIWKNELARKAFA